MRDALFCSTIWQTDIPHEVPNEKAFHFYSPHQLDLL